MIGKRTLLTIAVIMMMIVCAAPMYSDYSDADSSDVYEGDFLLDRGNGSTEWIKITAGGTYADTVINTLTAKGIQCNYALGNLEIENKISTSVGGSDTGGTFINTGTTGNTATSTWKIFRWDAGLHEWAAVAPADAYSDGPVAVGFYPTGILPVETPEYRSSWTMFMADAENSNNQTAEISSEISKKWTSRGNDTASGSYSSVLYARGHVFAKFGSSKAGSTNGSFVSFNETTGESEWKFDYPIEMIEMGSALIIGQYVFVQSSEGYIYKFDWAVGPGANNENVTTFNGMTFDTRSNPIPADTGAERKGKGVYGVGPYTMVGDSGSIFLTDSNGMVYCFDTDLNLLWSYQTEGGFYVRGPSVKDDYITVGSFDGCLYVLDKTSGSLIDKAQVYWNGKKGSVSVPSMIKNGTRYTIITQYCDEPGMGTTVTGLAIYSFDGTSLSLIKDLGDSIGKKISSYITRLKTDDFNGILTCSRDGIYKVDLEGNYQLVTDVLSGRYAATCPPTVVNGRYLYAATYDNYKLFTMGLDGKVTGEYNIEMTNNSMIPVTIVDNLILYGNDVGLTILTSTLPEYVPPEDIPKETPVWVILLIVLGVILGILIIAWLIMRFALKWEHPFTDLKVHIYTYFYGENYTHNTKSKRKLHAVILIGILVLIGVSLASLCLGNKSNFTPGEAVSYLISSLEKGGKGLTNNEYLIYVERMPRVIAAVGAGIGLSIAGAMYQAVIKNPLVEPYIMGVSSGAGTLAIAVIAFDFTLFGLFSSNSPYLIAICAIVGGLAAFGITMFLAVKTGGKSINYVLSGIVIGLVFSAVQSLMIIMAGHKITNALSWLYGSFVGITWQEAWLILIPVLALSFVPLIWAKEFNLILLGDDQAKQMGLNAEHFDKLMLISASVLTAFCVAFCGVIGFVGLVIPHLSRMIIGGDHRMMLPVSIALGGSLMVVADLLARILLSGFELPVGAVTTAIGAPVFAYLLIKRGRSYDD